jgi:hypothetical protein
MPVSTSASSRLQASLPSSYSHAARRKVIALRPLSAAEAERTLYEPEQGRSERLGDRALLGPGGTAASLGVAAAVVVGLVVVLPTTGADGAHNQAFAVTENADGTVTVEIKSIEDAEGLQRQLQEAGIPGAVYYLPPGKACSPREFDVESPPLEDRQAEMERQRLTITETEDGASPSPSTGLGSCPATRSSSRPSTPLLVRR